MKRKCIIAPDPRRNLWKLGKDKRVAKVGVKVLALHRERRNPLNSDAKAHSPNGIDALAFSVEQESSRYSKRASLLHSLSKTI